MQHDIIVVGGGPVGAATALGLHQQGFDVALVERAHAPAAFDPQQHDLRVYAISPVSARWLHTLGVWSGIAQQRACAYRAMRVWTDQPEQRLEFESGDIGAPQLGWIVEHHLMVSALWAALAEAAVPTYVNATTVEARFDESGAQLRLEDGQVLRARLCVAADGVDSQLRRMAGINTVGWRYGERAIVCHLHTEHAHHGVAWQRFLPSGPLAFLPLSDGRSSIVWSAEDRHAQALLEMEDAAFAAELTRASHAVLGQVGEMTARVAFPLRLQHAEHYVQPGLVLIGDAAHAVHPLAGQGVNLGMGDAESLVTTMTGAREQGRDWDSVRTLGRHERARKAANLEMLAVTDTLDKVFRSRVPGVRPVLGRGLGIVNRLSPLRQLLAQQAAVR